MTENEGDKKEYNETFCVDGGLDHVIDEFMHFGSLFKNAHHSHEFNHFDHFVESSHPNHSG